MYMNNGSILGKKEVTIIFLMLAVAVFFIHFTFLDLALKIGFKPDDWILYFFYKALGSNPVSKIAQVWVERGAYTAYQVYYLGLLESLVGFDYQSFQMTSMILKILATLSVFPLVLVIFKNKMLAYLTAVLYAISFSSIGSFEFAVKGSDYLAIFWMCIFLIVYYLIVKSGTRNILWLSIGLALLILTLSFSPIRLYPLLVLPLLVEVYLLINNQKLTNLKNILIRLFIFYFPFIILIIYSPSSVLGYLQSPFAIYKKVVEGNWHLILSPFSGIGYTFITNQYWGKIFGSVTIESMQEYLYFLLGGPAVIFGTLTLIVAFLRSKKPIPFFLFVFTANFILEVLVFFIATHYKYLPKEQGMHYEPTGIYSALFGIYILVLGVACFMEWIKSKKDYLLLAFWIGPLFLFIFVFGTWALAPLGTNFSPTSYYLVVSSMGSALLISSLLLTVFDKAKQTKNKLLKIILLFLVLSLIIAIFLMSSQEIRLRFSYLLKNGRSAEGQVLIQDRFRSSIGGIDLTKPALFYFDTSDIEGEGPFYSEGFLIAFPFWMHFEDNKLRDGCFEILYLNEHKQLLPYIREQDGRKGFFYRSLCVDKGKVSYKEILYGAENFYAFKIKNKDFIDIKEEVFEELGFE